MKNFKLIALTLVAVILTACSQTTEGYEEPSEPPRSSDEITYEEALDEEMSSIWTEKYEEALSINIENEKVIVEPHESASIEANKMLEDKTLYTNIKLSYLEDNPELFQDALVSFKATIEDFGTTAPHKDMGQQLWTIRVKDDTVNNLVYVDLNTVIHENDSDFIIENKKNKLEVIGPLYRGDEVIVYAHIHDMDEVLDDSGIRFSGMNAKIVEVVSE